MAVLLGLALLAPMPVASAECHLEDWTVLTVTGPDGQRYNVDAVRIRCHP